MSMRSKDCMYIRDLYTPEVGFRPTWRRRSTPEEIKRARKQWIAADEQGGEWRPESGFLTACCIGCGPCLTAGCGPPFLVRRCSQLHSGETEQALRAKSCKTKNYYISTS